MPAGARVARVLVDTILPQLDRPFDYAIPPRLRGQLAVGLRVNVPFGNGGRLLEGLILELAESSDYTGKLAEIDSVISEVPALSVEHFALLRSVADRYAGSLNDVIRLVVPKRYVRVEKSWALGERARAERPPQSHFVSAAPPDDNFPGLDSTIAAGGKVALTTDAGVVALSDGRWTSRWATLLAHTARQTLALGRSAILAVPDYRDQDQLQAALEAFIPSDALLRVDARQSGGERYQAFLEASSPVPRVIYGNRSAVLSPAHNLGLIALYNDDDPLLHESLAPYPQAREVALHRQTIAGCGLLFASPYRSVPVARLVAIGWLREIPARRQLRPRVVLTPEGEGPLNRARIPQAAWQQAANALTNGCVLVQVGAAGYVPALACVDCGTPARCETCGGPLAQPSRDTDPQCKWCGRMATAWCCRQCAGTRFRSMTVGSVRTAEELGKAFPGTRIVLSDGAHPAARVSGKQTLVVATHGAEPFAAGGYSAVLLLDANRALAREGLNANLDALRKWAVAASLAADTAPVVLVGVHGELGRAFTTWRFEDYAKRQLEDRKLLGLPPAVRVVSLRGPIASVEEAIASAQAVSGVATLGPTFGSDADSRAILRFPYSSGLELAAELKAVVVRQSGTYRASSRVRRRDTLTDGSPKLRVRFDDPEAL